MDINIKELQQEILRLKEEVATLKNIIVLTPGNIYWKDIKGQYLGCNNNMLKIARLNSQVEIIGKKDNELWDAKIARETIKIDREIMLSGQEKIIEEFGIDASGNSAIYLTHKIPIFDVKNNTIWLLGISLDITERKKIEQELYLTKEKIKADELFFRREIFALLPGNVYWKDKNGIFLDCNINLTKILGYNSLYEIAGKTDYEFMDTELADAVCRLDQEVMQNNREIVREEIGYDIYKNPAIYLSRKIPLHDKNGKVIGLLGVSFDITDRKKMEEELKIAKEKAEAALKAKEQAEAESKEKSLVLKDVLNDLNEKRYYLTGKYQSIYLTTREAQCIPCLARGLSAKEIGAELGLSKRTIEVYLNNLKAKLNCNSRSQLITAAIECRFLDGIRPNLKI